MWRPGVARASSGEQRKLIGFRTAGQASPSPASVWIEVSQAEKRKQERRGGLLSEGTAWTNRTRTEKKARLVDGAAAEEASKAGRCLEERMDKTDLWMNHFHVPPPS